MGDFDHVRIEGVNALGPMEAKVMMAARSASYSTAPAIPMALRSALELPSRRTTIRHLV
jgi:hypothetical protein